MHNWYSLGGGAEVGEYSHFPGSPLVVKFAPQRELLARATLTITHAGLNTTLESLNEGVPLVAVPITSEQPAIAARIRWTGTGDFIGLSHLTAKRLRLLIERVLGNTDYRNAAQRMKTAIRQTRGTARAVEIIEEVIRTQQPVLAAALEI
ncbi:MAG: glycosyltransferase [Bryobacteraceae bacterium]